ncbi:MAG: GntR family transcriptional regulator [Alphaproteobacteria bacterium]|nr:GntR family transcriptional regulator [Alphaproteobacteria bacterium]
MPPHALSIEQILRQRIARRHRPGDRFASELQLAREFGVSRTVIRKVLARLASDDLLSLEGRRGAFVGTARLPDGSAPTRPFAEEAATDEGGSRIEVVNIATIEGEGAIRKRLALAEAERLVVIERLIGTGSLPERYALSYVPYRLAAPLTKRDLQRIPVLQALAEKASVGICVVEETIEALLADIDVASRLQVGVGSALLLSERFYSDQAGTPLFLTQSYMRPGRYRLP